MEYTYEQLKEFIKLLELKKYWKKLELAKRLLLCMKHDDKLIINWDTGIYDIVKTTKNISTRNNIIPARAYLSYRELKELLDNCDSKTDVKDYDLIAKALNEMEFNDTILIDFTSGIYKIISKHSKENEKHIIEIDEEHIKNLINIGIDNFAIEFANWLDKLRPSERVSMLSKDGSMRGLFSMDNEQLLEKFKKVLKLKEQSKYCTCSYQIPKAISETEFECVNCGKEIKQ